jgi:hypothetical protein
MTVSYAYSLHQEVVALAPLGDHVSPGVHGDGLRLGFPVGALPEAFFVPGIQQEPPHLCHVSLVRGAAALCG